MSYSYSQRLERLQPNLRFHYSLGLYPRMGFLSMADFRDSSKTRNQTSFTQNSMDERVITLKYVINLGFRSKSM